MVGSGALKEFRASAPQGKRRKSQEERWMRPGDAVLEGQSLSWKGECARRHVV